MDGFFKSNMKWKPYPKNKFSGINHLGFIPSHWDVDKLKNLASVRGRLGFRGYTVNDLVSEGEGALTIGGKHIKNNMLNLTDPEYISWEKYYESPEIMVEKDDLLFAQRGSLGKAAVVENNIGPSTINPNLILLKNINLHSKYLYYYLISNYIYDTICMITSATAVPMVSQEQVKNLSILVPSMKEQENISAFLNCMITKIDALIAKKERLIELLRGKRAAVISHAVTKGLDPNVPMKDSGVALLGKVPEHWDISRIKWVSTKIGSGKTPKGGAERYASAGIIFLRSQNIHFDGLRLDDAVFIDEMTDNEMASTRVIPGDALLNITGASLGRCALAPINLGPANVNQHVCIIRPIKEKIQSSFLNCYLSSIPAQAQIFLSEDGISREGLTFVHVGSIAIPVMPFYEQCIISAFLDRETAKIDALIHQIQDSIGKQKEYRTALISAAVTGKIDVRNEVGGVV